MPNKPMDTSLFDKAAKFAIDAHAGTERRGKGFPYAIHVFEAAEIVASITNDQELIAAALLHDVIEDTNITEDQLRKEFGDRITNMVAGESEPQFPGLDERDTWVARKEFAINRLKNQSKEQKIVALGDKLSNMRAIARDFNKVGDQIWDLFHAPEPKLHQWHYEEMAKAFEELSDTEAYKEFQRLIQETFSRAFQ